MSKNLNKKKDNIEEVTALYDGPQDEASLIAEIRRTLVRGQCDSTRAKALYASFDREELKKQRELDNKLKEREMRCKELRINLERFKTLKKLGQDNLLITEILEEREVRQIEAGKK